MVGPRLLVRHLAKSAIWLTGRMTNVRSFNGVSLQVPPKAAAHIPPFIDMPYDPLEWEAIKLAVRAGDSCLDVGANIGVMTVLMSRLAGPTGHVIAAEPQPSVFGILVDLLERNGCHNATPLQALLMDRCGAAELHVSQATPLGVGSSAVMQENDSTASIRVAAVTIDALYDGQRGVDYIKIDAEGAERLILAGARSTLAQYQPVVQVEVHGQYMEEPAETISALFAGMAELGYRSMNLASRVETDAAAFLRDTHHSVFESGSTVDLRYRGYGQLLFIPVHRAELASALIAH